MKLFKKTKATKPFFDRLHREFVKEALESKILSELDGYFEIFKKWKTDKKAYEKELQKRRRVTKRNSSIFQYTRENVGREIFRVKEQKHRDSFEEAVLRKFKKKKDMLMKKKVWLLMNQPGNLFRFFDSWKGFSGYFVSSSKPEKFLQR